MSPLRERLSIAEEAAGRIREAILSGAYPQGRRLSDMHIAAEFGTSRGPIREALKVLRAEGLVVQKPHRGTYVVRVTAADLRDICELRVALETHAVRVLAAHATKADLSSLQRLVDKMERAAAEGDELAVSRFDEEFHDTLCRRSGSRRLHEVYERDVLNALSFFVFDSQVYHPISDMGREFRSLLEAIAAGDDVRASQLIESHIRRATELLSSRMDSVLESAESISAHNEQPAGQPAGTQRSA